MQKLSRRNLLQFAAITPLLLTAACSTVEPEAEKGVQTELKEAPKIGFGLPFGPEPKFPSYDVMYGAMSDGGFTLPAIPYNKINKRYLRQVVSDPTGEKAGTVVVDTRNHFLYLVLGNGKAIRYGVGLGRAGFAWSGRAEAQRKARWPNWHPPEEMIARDKKLAKYATTYDKETGTYGGGMEGGLLNPLGARAIYLFKDGKDTLYRLHGSPEWRSIGRSVSSGCVRLMNQDIVDLYSRINSRTPVLVK